MLILFFNDTVTLASATVAPPEVADEAEIGRSAFVDVVVIIADPPPAQAATDNVQVRARTMARVRERADTLIPSSVAALRCGRSARPKPCYRVK